MSKVAETPQQKLDRERELVANLAQVAHTGGRSVRMGGV
jgi:hypothetical protein